MTTTSSLTSTKDAKPPNRGTDMFTDIKGPIKDDPIHDFFEMGFFNGPTWDEALFQTAF